MTVHVYKELRPALGQDCFIAESADLVGDVRLGDGASVWYGAVVRGDLPPSSSAATAISRIIA